MKVKDVCGEIYSCIMKSPDYILDQFVRIHIGNQLYDIDKIDTVIDMDTNKQNIVIHVKDK